RFALEQFRAQREKVLNQKLVALSEKLGAIRACSADAAGCGKPACFKLRQRGRRQVEKNNLADDRRVALEQTLFVGMPQVQSLIFVWRLGEAAFVPLPMRERNAP